jgi:sodium-dependent dicarboxylate transporter 2/3/5
MLPVATPPNAVVFSSGYLEISDMVKAGVILDIIGCILITALLYFLIFPILGINPTILPEWAL